ncbi:MAG: hypothetical protein LBT31_01975 [Synergistaceae bacterium]|jgi:diacylglycerol kinase family enzyme|nr:hypothetical protein [Synergistaceae bacterium]
MRHLFIVNPVADGLKGHLKDAIGKIRAFLDNHSQLSGDIHITRWKRDAVGFVRRYVQETGEFVRVYAVGGTSTLFEVVNGAIGLPNVQIANYPLGRCNSFVRCFGDDKLYLFQSLRNLAFSETIAVDVIRCGFNYSIAFGALGVESTSGRTGEALMDWVGYNADVCYRLAAVYYLLRSDSGENYRINLDGVKLDGNYVSILAANQPCYGINLKPGVGAVPNDGLLDLYLVKKTSRFKQLRLMHDYINGQHGKWFDYISHHTGRRVSVSSENVMCICADGERFYNTSIDFEIIPYAVDFVCPKGVRALRA